MIVGFGFTKLSAEKNKNVNGKIDISNNVSIKSIEEDNLSLGQEKQKVLKFIFEFTSKYEPEIGNMDFEGEVLFLAEPKQNKEILSMWKKDKKLPKEIMSTILNAVLTKCNIKAILLSQEINLPPPVPLPAVQVEQTSDYIG